MRLNRTFLARASLIALAAGALVWWQRKPIADEALREQLAKRGVEAHYTVSGLGFRWQKLDHLVIGDPANPDLTADHAEIRLAAGLGGVRLTEFHASGVRLRGRLADGKVSWGSLDRLIPTSNGEPFTLPAINATLSDARVRLDTPWGAIAARFDGSGKLSDGFRGKMGAVMPLYTTKHCTAQGMSAYVDLEIKERRPQIVGPLRAARLVCEGSVIERPNLAFDAHFSEALDAWEGTLHPDIPRVLIGRTAANGVAGTVSFKGTRAKTLGHAVVGAQTASVGRQNLSGVALNGDFMVSDDATGLRGAMSVAHWRPGSGYAAQMAGLTRSAEGTPVAPLLAQLGHSVAAIHEASASASFDSKLDAGGLSVKIDGATAKTDSGAHFTLSGARGLQFGAMGLLGDGWLKLRDGGFPAIDARFSRTRGGNTQGQATIAAFAAPGARMALTPISFTATPAGALRFATQVTLDGPLQGGRIEGLRAPLTVERAVSGAMTINPGCSAVSIARLQVSALSLDPARLNLCADGGGLANGVTLAGLKLSGRLGTAPMQLAATRAHIGVDGAWQATGLATVLGRAGEATRLNLANVNGSMAGGAMAGKFAGLDGRVGTVPLLIDQGTGAWSYRQSRLSLGGAARVRDAYQEPRFFPLVSHDFKLTLADNRIDATATLNEPTNGDRVVGVTIWHQLANGTGHADLAVDNLIFGKTLQPEMLTSLTLGVVANVQGAINGHGAIDWTSRGITSGGKFATESLDLAAAFGPVAGLKGAIEFDDLLALSSRSSEVDIDSINPGMPVLNGKIRFRLLPEQRVAVEGGEWPFAGGKLLLEPTIMDMSAKAERHLTFRVAGLDAAKFIDQLQFQNFAGSGVFDGDLPMIFDASGGRIEGGHIVVRDPGGTLAYVGAVSNASMNAYAKLAFDALKSLRYRSLAIDLNGPLDGEMVSKVVFSGISNADPDKRMNFIMRQLLKLPFKFNVTVRAPFRALISTARGVQDPTLLLQRYQVPATPPLAKGAGQAPVQPPSSDTVK